MLRSDCDFACSICNTENKYTHWHTLVRSQKNTIKYNTKGIRHCLHTYICICTIHSSFRHSTNELSAHEHTWRYSKNLCLSLFFRWRGGVGTANKNVFRWMTTTEMYNRIPKLSSYKMLFDTINGQYLRISQPLVYFPSRIDTFRFIALWTMANCTKRIHIYHECERRTMKDGKLWESSARQSRRMNRHTDMNDRINEKLINHHFSNHHLLHRRHLIVIFIVVWRIYSWFVWVCVLVYWLSTLPFAPDFKFDLSWCMPNAKQTSCWRTVR